MLIFLGKTLLAGIIISFCSWLSGKNVGLAGFITALPLISMLAIAFSFMEHGDRLQSATYAKSVLVAVPLSLLFFIPFLLTKKFELSFWTSYASGTALLAVGFVAHHFIFKNI